MGEALKIRLRELNLEKSVKRNTSIYALFFTKSGRPYKSEKCSNNLVQIFALEFSQSFFLD